MQENTSRPNITPLIIIFGNYLRSHIIRSAYYFVVTSQEHLLIHVFSPFVGKAKINESYLVIIGTCFEAPSQESCLQMLVVDVIG
jgi:hypothetical protein